MIRLKLILQETLRHRKSVYGEFIRVDFRDGDAEVGYTNIRLKKGWNQLHVDVAEAFQGKGYAKQMIAYNIAEYGYVVFPEDRITNPMMHHVIAQFERDSAYQVFKTKYDEIVIANYAMTQEEIEQRLA